MPGPRYFVKYIIAQTTGALTKKIAALPSHVQAGLQAYRTALSRRKDWHQAVTAAIEAAEAAKSATGEQNGDDR